MVAWTEARPYGPQPGSEFGGDFQHGEGFHRRWYRPAADRPGWYLVIDEHTYVVKTPDDSSYVGPAEHYIEINSEFHIVRGSTPRDLADVVLEDVGSTGEWMGDEITKCLEINEPTEADALAEAGRRPQPLVHTWDGEQWG